MALSLFLKGEVYQSPITTSKDPLTFCYILIDFYVNLPVGYCIIFILFCNVFLHCYCFYLKYGLKGYAFFLKMDVVLLRN